MFSVSTRIVFHVNPVGAALHGGGVNGEQEEKKRERKKKRYATHKEIDFLHARVVLIL